ncbi:MULTISPECIES: hypothetical protein [unclassified Streptomyces]|nr:hypothetical protein OH827_00245 [Streptomyces sp. NBC_00891]WSY03544.1 hypothetical protein OG464_00245 [Streptomyces sp. NBC_00890]WSZ05171.1 hypothetical protein OG704_00245 [Streptomyces sp. NBC_00869]WSZ27334.1 hypothetical protein OG498_33320 [Streptomyces sp. NBC_00870]
MQYCLTDRGLFPAAAWVTTSVFALSAAFLLAAALRRLPGCRQVL